MTITIAFAMIFLLRAIVISPLLTKWQNSTLRLNQVQKQYISTLKLVQRSDIIPIQTFDENNGQDELANLFKDIQTAAGTQVLMVRFQPRISSLELKSHRSLNGSATDLRKLQVKIECTGRFADLMTFYERLEKKDLLTRIQHIYLTPEGRDSENLLCQMVIVRIII